MIPVFTIPTPSTLSGFSYGLGNGPSAAQSFTFSGQNLTDTVRISIVTANFEISLDSVNYVSNVTGPLIVVPVAGTVPDTKVFARLKAGLAVSAVNYLNKKVTIASAGAVSVQDTLNGVVYRPTIVPSALSIPGFTYVFGSGPSAEQTFTVSANIYAPLGIKAPADYEISLTSGAGFTDSITLTPSQDIVSTTTIYVRLKAGLAVAPYVENIVLTATSATTQNIVCNGTVTSNVPVPTLDVPVPSTLNGFVYPVGSGPSAEKTFTLSGSNLTDTVKLRTGNDYEISTASGSGFSSGVFVLPVTGTLAPTTFYVRLKTGLPVGVYNESVAISSTGANSPSVVLAGNVTDTASGAAFAATWPFLTDTLPTVTGNMTASGAMIDPSLFTRVRSYGVSGLKGMGTNGKVATPFCSNTYNSAGTTNPITPYMEMDLGPVSGYTASLNPFTFTIKGDSITSANMVVTAGYSVDNGITFTGFSITKNSVLITPTPDTLGTYIATGDTLSFAAPALAVGNNGRLKIRIMYWKNASATTSGNRIILSPVAITGTTSPVAACLVNTWTGSTSTAWEEPTNWTCGTIPNANSEVHINSGLTNYPVIQSAATCKKLYTASGASVTVNAGFTLNITGHN